MTVPIMVLIRAAEDLLVHVVAESRDERHRNAREQPGFVSGRITRRNASRLLAYRS